MIVLLEATLSGMGSPPPSAPALQLADELAWSEDPLRWQLKLPATPEQVAQMIRRHSLPQDPEHPYVFASRHENAEIRLTVACQAGEWEELEAELRKEGKPRTSQVPSNLLKLEWPFLHPALSQLSKGTVKLGPAWLQCSPSESRMVMYLPADDELLETLRLAGYVLQPSSDWQEDVMWGEVIMGRIFKPEREGRHTPEGPAPFLMLHGLASSLGNPLLMRPFAAPLEISDIDEMMRIVEQSCQEPAELEIDDEDISDLDRTFRKEYAGFSADDLEMLMRTAIGFTEGIATDTCELYDIEELEEEWMRSVFRTLVTAIISGSRVARAELARAGHDTSLDRGLGEEKLSALINGQLTFADATRRAIRDDRAWRCWSLGWGAAQTIEGLLAELLADELPEEPAPEGVLGDLLVCFDLGVRYQMARVAPELLAVPEPLYED